MDKKKLIESLSPNEIKILPHLRNSINDICKKSNLDKTSVLRSLEYLQNKKILKINQETKKIVDLGLNGIQYLKKGLPERTLLNVLNEKRILQFTDAQKESKLTDDEFKAALGALKLKALIEIKNGKIIFSAKKEEISKKSLEEIFIELLPMELEKLAPEQLFALKSLQKRKDIIHIEEQKIFTIEITPVGKELMNTPFKHGEFIEQVTPELLKKETNWKSKKFRRYDVTSHVPEIYGGKKHFVNQSIDYARKVWTEMGFKEMTGNLTTNSLWNFDALFTAQDHPVREMQDTFFINKKEEIEEKKLMAQIKKAHEEGVDGSKGWQYKWKEDEAKKMLLRTHTTCLSTQTLSKLKKEDLPVKFFAIGKVFRNETLDWKHFFEFNQTEGIVVDEKVNLRHLLGYLKQFAEKMGFKKVRFRPGFFPYTEPSVEGDVWNEEKKEWVEVFSAGIFRPEVTEPLLGKPTPVLAWGPGFDRMIMNIFEVKDIRELYKNDIKKLRKIKFLIK